jgi:hypothetical protein
MGKKLNRVYEALLDGASKGLADDDLYHHVQRACPQTPSQRIVKASLLALTDPEVKDRNILHVIYALAIKYRMVSLGVADDGDYEDGEDPSVPAVTADLKKRLETSVSPLQPGAPQNLQ